MGYKGHMQVQGKHHVVSLSLRGSGQTGGGSEEEQSQGGQMEHQACLCHIQSVPVSFSEDLDYCYAKGGLVCRVLPLLRCSAHSQVGTVSVPRRQHPRQDGLGHTSNVLVNPPTLMRHKSSQTALYIG